MNYVHLFSLLAVGAVAIGCESRESTDVATTTTTTTDTSTNARPVVVAQEGEAKQWDKPPAMQIDPAKSYSVTLKTNRGDITIRLFAKDAPKTVNNFVFLAKNDFYDGVIFHRVINNFMIQGGDPDGRGTGGPGYEFEDELKNNPNRHEPFTLSMANSGPNTNGSQFFITEGATPHLDGKHTVFGRVTEGQDVVQAITDTRTGAGDRPVEPVVIEDIVVHEEGAEAPTTTPASE